MKNKLKTTLSILLSILFLVSCNSENNNKSNIENNNKSNTENNNKTNTENNNKSNTENNNKTINDLITHLNNNGFNGKKKEMFFALIGAIDGISYKGETFSVEIYKFKESKNIPDMLTYKNGNFGMIVHRPTESERIKLLEVFNSFK